MKQMSVNRKMSFSVLMSVYEKEQADYLNLSLKSILEDQTLAPDEVILVLDGPISNELSLVVQSYVNKNSNLKVVPIEKNVGLGRALNYGLERCSHELVLRADSDDICVPERFEKQIEYFANNLDIDILGGYIEEFIDESDSPINTKKMPLSHKEIVKMAKFRNPINHMTVAFKKSKIIEIDSYLDLPYLEDYFLWIRSINKNLKINNLDLTLVKVRIGNGMLIRRSNKKYISSWKTLNRYMIENNMITKTGYLRNIFSIYIFIYSPKWIKMFYYKYILRKKKASN